MLSCLPRHRAAKAEEENTEFQNVVLIDNRVTCIIKCDLQSGKKKVLLFTSSRLGVQRIVFKMF